MKNILVFKYKIRSLALLFVAAGLTFMYSCEEDESLRTDEIILSSFGPSGVSHGDEVIFIGENMDKVSSVVFQPDITVERSEFMESSRETFKVVVPQGAEAGKVMLNTPQGQIESKSILNFKVDVTISSITAEAKPGTDITIAGDKINWIESVTFTSDIVVEQGDFVSQSQTELVVTVPMEAQSGFLIFSTGGTEPLTFGSEEELTVTLPAVTGLNPSSIRHAADLTLVGTDLDLVTEVIFIGGESVLAADFVSQSETEIVVTVPSTTEKGILTLKQLSPVDVETEELTITLPVGTSLTPSPAVPGEDDITITGTDLDLVQELQFPGVGPIASFLSHSATEIVLSVPAEATQGAVSYVTIHGYEGPLGVILKLPPTGSYPTLDYYIYKDGLQNGWEAWGGWGHVSQEYENNENPADGEFAIKSVFNDPYGAVQIHNSGATNVFSGFNYLVFYVYVEGEDSEIIAQIDDNSDYYPAGFTGDKYHQIVVPLADLEGSGNVSELRIKNNNSDAATNNTTVFIDEIGLTIDEPEAPYEAPDTYIYEDGMAEGWDTWDGWGHTSKDWESEENPYRGTASIKVVYNDNYGALQIHPQDNTALTGYSELVLYVYFEADGRYAVQFNDAGEQEFDVIGGQFNRLVVQLDGFADQVADLNELRFKNFGTTQNHTVYIDEIGLNF